MPTSRAVLASGLILIAWSAAAQPAPPPPPPLPPTDVARGEAAPMQGTVARLLPTPMGEVDGLVLADGRVVRFPPHLSAALMGVAGQGDGIAIDGMAEGAAGTIRAWRITNRSTGRSITDAPPPGPPQPRAWSGRDMQVSGVVQRTLTGPRGEVNGVILDNGTVVRFSPPVGEAFAGLLVPGRTLAAQGYGSNGPGGTAIEAVALGNSPAELLLVGPGGGQGFGPPRRP
jgi:hypothetical protein